MKNKKLLFGIIALIVVVAAALLIWQPWKKTSETVTPVDTEKPVATEAPTETAPSANDGGLTFTTGGTAGTYYAYGNVLAQYVAGNSDVAMTAVAGNGSADNIDKLDMQVAQLGFVQNDVAYYAHNGIRIYEGDPVESFTAIAALYTETFS